MENFDFKARFVEICGTSQPRAISKMLGVSYQAAKNYLSGRLPGTRVLLIISVKTTCSIHWLLTGEGDKHIKNKPKKRKPTLTDEMRSLVRRECLEVFNDLITDSKEVSQQATVILTSDEIKNEKVIEESVTDSTKQIQLLSEDFE